MLVHTWRPTFDKLWSAYGVLDTSLIIAAQAVLDVTERQGSLTIGLNDIETDQMRSVPEMEITVALRYCVMHSRWR